MKRSLLAAMMIACFAGTAFAGSLDLAIKGYGVGIGGRSFFGARTRFALCPRSPYLKVGLLTSTR